MIKKWLLFCCVVLFWLLFGCMNQNEQSAIIYNNDITTTLDWFIWDYDSYIHLSSVAQSTEDLDGLLDELIEDLIKSKQIIYNIWCFDDDCSFFDSVMIYFEDLSELIETDETDFYNLKFKSFLILEDGNQEQYQEILAVFPIFSKKIIEKQTNIFSDLIKAQSDFMIKHKVPVLEE